MECGVVSFKCYEVKMYQACLFLTTFTKFPELA